MKRNKPTPLPSLSVNVPAFLSERAGTAEGARLVKKTIGAALTGLTLTGPDLLPAEEISQLLTDLNTLIDRVFVERINQTATLAGAVKTPDKLA